MGAENRRSGSFGFVLQEIMRDRKLSAEAKSIYCYLASFADADGCCFPSLDLMLQELGISRARFYRHFEQLTNSGIVKVSQIRNGNRFGKNVYTVLLPDFEYTHSENADKYEHAHKENTHCEKAHFENAQNSYGNNTSTNNPRNNITKEETYLCVCGILNEAKAQLRSKGRLKPDRFTTDEAFRICGSSDDALIAAARAFAKDAVVLLKRGFTWCDFRDYCRKQNLSPKTGDTKRRGRPND